MLVRFWEENQIWSTTYDEQAVLGAPEDCTVVAARDERSPRTLYVYVAAQVPTDLTVPFADQTVEGTLELEVDPGDYLVYWFAPATGGYFGWETLRSMDWLRLQLPGTANDVVAIVRPTA
jgi:hypothetical protein